MSCRRSHFPPSFSIFCAGLDLVAAVDLLTDGGHVVVAQVLGATGRVNAGCGQDPACRLLADAIDMRQRVKNRLIIGQVNTRDTSQTDLLLLPKSEKAYLLSSL